MNNCPLEQKVPVLMIVDDDPAIRILVQQSLQPHGYDVNLAESGEQAMALFTVTPPDLILLDINMPGMDGIETCRQIRALAQGKLIPILILTGSDDVESIHQAYEAGATDFIIKPINWPILIHHVRYMLRAGQAIIDQQHSDQIQQLMSRLSEAGNQRFDSLDELFGRVLTIVLTDRTMTGSITGGAVYLLHESGYRLAVHRAPNCQLYPKELCVQPEQNAELQAPHSFISTPLFLGDKIMGAMLFQLDCQNCAVQLSSKLLDAISQKVSQLVAHIQSELETQLAAEVFSNSLDAIAITDHCGNLLRVNHNFEAVTGYKSQEAVGQNMSILRSGYQDQLFYQSMWERLLATGKWQGEIWNRRKNGEVYPEWLRISGITDKQGRVTKFIAVFADISKQKAQENKIQKLAYYDDLTGLANRALLKDHLQLALAQAKRSAQCVAILFIDLDRFKNINDSLGHVYGDQLLDIVAGRLRNTVREGDTVARQGGDEFIVILTHLTGNQVAAQRSAEKIAKDVLQALMVPVHLTHHELMITGSIGIALYPKDGRSDNDLIKYADTAMYAAKEHGRNRYEVFQAGMAEMKLHRFSLENALKKAIANEEFSLQYQPQVNISNNQVIGAESLIRWYNDTLGWISPMDFIPLAEEAGLIYDIDNWVLKTACKKLREWEQSGILPKSTCRYITVNVSARQFSQKDFVHRVAKIILSSGLKDLTRLELELTEGCLIHNSHEAIRTLLQLRAIGLRISIDDFGTGYSSLSYLKDFPLDTLKIDRSFICECTYDKNTQAIVRAIIAMAQGLGLNTIAEGVETIEQLNTLKTFGCDIYQGYLFSRPLVVSEFEKLLVNEHPKLSR